MNTLKWRENVAGIIGILFPGKERHNRDSFLWKR